MLLLTKVVLSLMVGFLTSVVFGIVLIPFLKKLNFGQRIGDYVGENHRKKEGTPTMGGLIFIIPTILTIVYLCLTDRIEFTYNLGIVLLVFVLYAFLGFLDDFLSIKRGKNEGLTISQKFFGQIVIALLFFYIYMKYDGDTTFVVSTLNINIELGFFYGIFILLLLVGFSNAVNLTDGLDGLAGGLSAISFVAFALISLFIGQEDMGIFCFILVGTLFGFLMFNAYPAKVFMGDTGSLALGAVFATIAILTRREVTLLIVCFPFVFETLSSIIQIGYYKLTKKRVFLNSPIHHHFEKKGFAEPDIVKAFYLFGIIFSLLGIFFAVWI
ncbi:MAG: phospho-N-acetylmuramoyl-pentapeptide-transferase [bacterium]|nr:phospho-N-acetylmuramoyl-pentapeptide-transferase [bacterium]